MNSNELLNVPVQNQSEVFANESMSQDNSFASPMDAAHQRIRSHDSRNGQSIISPNFQTENMNMAPPPNAWDQSNNPTPDVSVPELNKTGVSIDNIPNATIQVKHKVKSFGGMNILPNRAQKIGAVTMKDNVFEL